LGRGYRKLAIFSVLSVIFVLSISLVLSQNTEALKSEGNPLTEVSSKKVCGLSLCDEPMSIEEKIALFYQKLSGGESTVLQQAIDPRLMDPLKVKPGTIPLREALSTKQLEQAKVRQLIPTTPTSPSVQQRTGEMASIEGGIRELPAVQSEYAVLPCVGCITAGMIASNAVGASEIAANAVGASEIGANAVGASEIGANAVGASELNMSIKSFTVKNNGGSTNTKQVSMVPVNGNNFCFLVKVKMENVDTGGETAECDIDYGGKTHWVLQAILGEPNNDANVSCQAVCISYG